MLILVFIIILVLLVIDHVFLKKIFINSRIKTITNEFRSKSKIKVKGQGRGIVIPVKQADIDKALLLISILGTEVPITITATQNNEIFTRAIIFSEITEEQLDIHSLINSPYMETILLQPDILFFNAGSESVFDLFNNEIYQQTGTLFWKDPLNPETSSLRQYSINLIKDLIPYEIPDNPITNRSSTSFQAEGIIVFDKSNHPKTLHYLSILNDPEIIKSLGSHKELYWIATELAQEPYGFNPSLPGIIGNKNKVTGMICGYNLYSFSRAQLTTFASPRISLGSLEKFVWWKGGLLDVHDKVIEFSHYAFPSEEVIYNNLAAFFSYGTCASGMDVQELTLEMKNVINNYIYIFHNLRKKYPNIF